MNPMRFPFLPIHGEEGQTDFMPFLPIRLSLDGRQIETHGLLDTAASVNVLPFSIGIALGAVWEQQSTILSLVGNLAAFEARALLLTGTVEGFPSIRLAFAWTLSDEVPVLLGQTNFFMEFDAFFSRSAMYFEVSPRK